MFCSDMLCVNNLSNLHSRLNKMRDTFVKVVGIIDFGR